LLENPEIGIVGSNALIKHEDGKYYITHQQYDDEKIKSEILKRCPFVHSTTIYKKTCRENAKGYPENIKYADDV